MKVKSMINLTVNSQWVIVKDKVGNTLTENYAETYKICKTLEKYNNVLNSDILVFMTNSNNDLEITIK